MTAATIIESGNSRYRVMGTTDDCTTCDRCGKPHLKNTIILGLLDADGNIEDVVYYGSTCARRALGVQKSRLDRAVIAARNERRTNEEMLARWSAYLDDGEAGITRFIVNNPHCLDRWPTRTAVHLMIAKTVREIECRLAIPARAHRVAAQ